MRAPLIHSVIPHSFALMLCWQLLQLQLLSCYYRCPLIIDALFMVHFCLIIIDMLSHWQPLLLS